MDNPRFRSWLVAAAAIATIAFFAGCECEHGAIRIDGSSTVFPISQAVAEAYQKERGGLITIGVSGTGGGMKKFCRGEIAIAGASRPIRPSEIDMCKAAGIEFIELPVAYDGIAVTVHPSNDWAQSLTVSELKKMWAPSSQETITRWSQIRAGWPDMSLRLYGPGISSGTYDYFTEAIVGKEHTSRGDFTSSEDDNVLVQGISTDPAALGFFGFAYYDENREKLKAVPIDDGDPQNGEGPILPTIDTIKNGTYQPLSRPLFIYVSAKAAKKRAISDLVAFYLSRARKYAIDVGYIPLPETAYALVVERFDRRITGTVFGEGSAVGVTVEELLKGQ